MQQSANWLLQFRRMRKSIKKTKWLLKMVHLAQGVLINLFVITFPTRVRSKWVVILGSLLGGLFGMTRGWAFDFVTMIVVMALINAVTPFVLMNGYKVIGQWFPSKQLGLANGVIATDQVGAQFAGTATGFVMAPLWTGAPFEFWPALVALGAICIWIIKEGNRSRNHLA